MSPAYRDPDQRFWDKVDKAGDDGCWLWTGSCNPKGYGYFNAGRDAGGRIALAHHWAYQRYVGEVPAGMLVDHRHTCPKRCVRSTHLRLLTPKQNEENRSGATRRSRTGVRGVFPYRNTGRFQASVGHHGKKQHVGIFDTIEEASAAVRARRLELFTHNDADRGE